MLLLKENRDCHGKMFPFMDKRKFAYAERRSTGKRRRIHKQVNYTEETLLSFSGKQNYRNAKLSTKISKKNKRINLASREKDTVRRKFRSNNSYNSIYKTTHSLLQVNTSTLL